MANDFIKVELNKVFEDKDIFSRDDLFNFFLRFDPKMRKHIQMAVVRPETKKSYRRLI